MKSIEEQIFRNATERPDKVALIAGDVEVTYAQLWERCLRAALMLTNSYNLKRGDRVILAAAGNIEFVYAYFGIHLAGGICVPIDPDTNETRFRHILTSTKPVCVMGVLNKVDCSSLELRVESLELREESVERREESLEVRGESLELRVESLELRVESLELREESVERREESVEVRVESLELREGGADSAAPSLSTPLSALSSSLSSPLSALSSSDCSQLSSLSSSLSSPLSALSSSDCSQLSSLSSQLSSLSSFECSQLNSLSSQLSSLSLNSIADILFTTGTTGAPKGVALSYCNVAAAARNINTFIGNTADDVELLALPVSHSFGLGRMRCVLSLGGTLVMLGTFANIKKFFGEMKRCQVTGFGMVPASWGFIKKMSGKYIGKFAEQLKYIEIGSSFMPTADKELLMELLPDTRICMHYGSTEASRSAFMEFHNCKDNLLTAGHASPNVEIKIFSPEGVELPTGEEGEVCVKGEHVTCSYWNETPERFALDFYGEYFRTGDCATMDADGNIYLKSRIKEMINVGGKKVAPMEVEDILNTLPGIKESACIGIPDPDGVMGEVVKAFVVVDGDIADAEIIEQLRPKLEVYKIPVALERIAAIPRTSSGKIQRLKLKR